MFSEDRIAKFIQSSFPSVWALELLCFLRENDSEKLDKNDLISRMRASELIVDQSVASLTAAGLVAQEKGRVFYHPATDETAKLVGQTVDFYAKSPDAVRRLIVASSVSASNISAFADSFRFRNE